MGAGPAGIGNDEIGQGLENEEVDRTVGAEAGEDESLHLLDPATGTVKQLIPTAG